MHRLASPLNCILALHLSKLSYKMILVVHDLQNFLQNHDSYSFLRSERKGQKFFRKIKIDKDRCFYQSKFHIFEWFPCLFTPFDFSVLSQHAGYLFGNFNIIRIEPPEKIYFPKKRLNFLLISGNTDFLDCINSIRIDTYNFWCNNVPQWSTLLHCK